MIPRAKFAFPSGETMNFVMKAVEKHWIISFLKAEASQVWTCLKYVPKQSIP